ncbi:MAG: hypothetical protein JWN03_170 [Nocardia sp.]|uniref:hypothetical protein n=1 Tax=Nocardia sp. TaxID=1821 RepID=UPI00263230EC|nr:hypothetical protein [Nocardia sp.]MCU1639895.1 hypothetical protein [Nocardia sp.]
MTTRNFGGLVPHLNNASMGLAPQLGQPFRLPVPLPDPPMNPSLPHTNATWDTPPTVTTTVNLGKLDQYGSQMKGWAEAAVKYGNEAHVDPDLVLAMALQEGAPLRTGYRGARGTDRNLLVALNNPSTYPAGLAPYGEEAGEAYDRARLAAALLGVTKHDDDSGNSIGLTNMKVGPFKEVINKYPDEFPQGERALGDLIGNDDLAMKVTAYNLKMLYEGAATQATSGVRATPLDQFLGSGYNAGGKLERSQDVASGHGHFSGENDNTGETEHGRSTLGVVQVADQILYGSGAYK